MNKNVYFKNNRKVKKTFLKMTKNFKNILFTFLEQPSVCLFLYTTKMCCYIKEPFTYLVRIETMLKTLKLEQMNQVFEYENYKHSEHI